MKRTRASNFCLLTALILASSMAFIDGTVVNLALPSLQATFKATVADVQWVMESYLIFLSALLLVGGSLGDRRGRRLIFLTGVGLFSIASACCGFAWSMEALIIARGVQGIGGALMVPGSLSLLSASFEEKERGAAIGTWSGFSAITTAIGPVLGGWLIQHGSWRLIFFLNLPLAAAVVILTLLFVPESRQADTGQSQDLFGPLWATVSLGCIVFGLIELPGRSLRDPGIAGFLALGLLAFFLFVLTESRASNPMVSPALFRSRNFSGANLLTLFLYCALSGIIFFLVLELVMVEGYSTTQAGSALLPFAFLLFLLSRWSGGLVDRYGSKMPLIVGPSISAAGFLSLSFPATGGTYWATYFPGVLILGFGMAITVAPLTTTVMNALSDLPGVASGVNNAVARVAGLLGIALFGLVMITTFNHRLDSRLSGMRLSSELVKSIDAQRSKLLQIELPAGLNPPERAAIERAMTGSFADGFRNVARFAAALALASALASLLLIE